MNNNNDNDNKNGNKGNKGNKGGESREMMIRRLDKDIDEGGDIRRREERDNLKIEGMGLLLRSRGLMDISLLLVKEAEGLAQERDKIGVGDYEKMEAWYRAVDIVDKKLGEVNRILREMEVKYKELRVRVNKFYGMDVMKEYDDLFEGIPEKDYDDDDDKGYEDKGGGIGIDEKGFGFDIGGDDGGGFKEGDVDWWKK